MDPIPQYYDMYNYCGGNTTNKVDPNGEDAINIVFKGYPINTGVNNPITNDPIYMPLGHAAVISVDPKSGSTRYYEYGRYGGKFGNVLRQKIPDVVMGSDGSPTTGSLNNLYSFISKKYGKEHDVKATYHADSDFQKVNSFAEGVKNDPNRDPYSIPGNTCYTFANKAVKAGKTVDEKK